MTFCKLTIYNDNTLLIRLCLNRIFATGVACRQGTLTLPDTWSRPFGTCIYSTCWDQSFSKLVVILSDYALRISLGTFSILLYSTGKTLALHRSLVSDPVVHRKMRPLPEYKYGLWLRWIWNYNDPRWEVISTEDGVRGRYYFSPRVIIISYPPTTKVLIYYIR